jgi:hypothetical protein
MWSPPRCTAASYARFTGIPAPQTARSELFVRLGVVPGHLLDQQPDGLIGGGRLRPHG